MFHRFVPISTSQGIAFGRHTAFHRPNAAPPTAAGDEAFLSARGWGSGIANLKETVLAGPGIMARSVADDLYRAFGSDADVIRWSALKAYDFTRRPQPEENKVLSSETLAGWLLFNHFFYAGLLILAMTGLCGGGAPRFLTGMSVRFLMLHLLVLWSILALVPGVSRYHFSLMIPVVMLAGLGGMGPLKGAAEGHRDKR